MVLILSPQKAGRVVQAALRYFLDGTEPEPMADAETNVFLALRENIDDSLKDYQEMCQRNKTNRAKGRITGGQPPDDGRLTSRRRLGPKAEAEEETEAESEVEEEVREEEVRIPAARAAADLLPSERDAIAYRIMYGTATAEDFENYRNYFHRDGRES